MRLVQWNQYNLNSKIVLQGLHLQIIDITTHAVEMENQDKTNGQNGKPMKRGEGGKTPSRKLNDVCISRIYATVRGRNGVVNVTYIPAHTNHTLSIKEEAKHLPLPVSTRNEIAAKLHCGISVNRIMEGILSIN